jgi:hypothetical protein
MVPFLIIERFGWNMDRTDSDQGYLPDYELQVDRKKIVDYLLDEANSKGKASFFLSTPGS